MTKKTTKLPSIPFFACLLIAIIIGLLYFKILYHYDNKYTWPHPPSKMGITTVNLTDDKAFPLFYLVDDWEYYDGKLLTPEQISSAIPDEYLYIGKYGGFDRGNPDKSPYGCATYRLTIFTDDALRRYALEVPRIYSQWKLYINGELEADHLNLPGTGTVVFSAQGMIEIIFAVSDDKSLYSGLTYPPAFGTPGAVGKILTQRLLIHAAGVVFTLLLAFICSLITFAGHNTRQFRKFILLCLCVSGSISYPLTETLQMTWDGWLVIERFCYYTTFLIIMLLQADICKIRRRVVLPVVAASVLVLSSVLLQPLIAVDRAAVKYLYSDFLSAYKWLTASWLIITSLWAISRNIYGSKTLMVTSVLFSCALCMDRLYPLFEPVRSGWPVETFSFIYLLAIGLIICQNTVSIYQKETALEAALQSAAMKEQALVEANQLKSQFLSNISHELKIPLTVVSGYAQLASAELTDTNVAIPELQDHMRRIIRESDRMEQMVLQLLDITKIETDRFSLDIEPASIEELIQQAADIHFPLLNDHHNVLLLEIQPNMPPILCDGTRILQVLINLLSNACRHTTEGTITIRAAAANEQMTVSVTDTGEGIPAENLPGLFERYLRGGASKNGTVKGTGLGLYICKIIIEAHNGSISVFSIPDSGTEFRFTLPVDLTAAMEVMKQNEQ